MVFSSVQKTTMALGLTSSVAGAGLALYHQYNKLPLSTDLKIVAIALSALGLFVMALTALTWLLSSRPSPALTAAAGSSSAASTTFPAGVGDSQQSTVSSSAPAAAAQVNEAVAPPPAPQEPKGPIPSQTPPAASSSDAAQAAGGPGNKPPGRSLKTNSFAKKPPLPRPVRGGRSSVAPTGRSRPRNPSERAARPTASSAAKKAPPKPGGATPQARAGSRKDNKK